MKKMLAFMCLCLTALLLAACTPSSAGGTEPAPTQEALLIDLDLSKLSATVAYSQLDNIMYDPAPYLGKVIKMAGYYSVMKNSASGQYYHACVVSDVTACCALGLEFVWLGEHTWPDDYPLEGAQIQVTGMLDSYVEDNATYLHLIDAEVTW